MQKLQILLIAAILLLFDRQVQAAQYAVVAGCTAGEVSRYNYVATEAEAQRLVDRLNGVAPSVARVAEMQAMIDDPNTTLGMRFWANKEQQPLDLEDQVSAAYYVVLAPPSPNSAAYLHKARFWDCNTVAKTVAFNEARLTNSVRDLKRIDAYLEAEKRKTTVVVVGGVTFSTDVKSSAAVGVDAARGALFDQIDAATLADLEALNVATWAGWP